jgi:molybdopterin-guanine dinucleotide biosynthesis protein A
MAEPFDAVILAGGRGSRLGGVSKADLVVGGVRLLDRVLAAAAGASTVVVVGRVAVPDGVLLTMEEPPGSGPAAGLVAGLDAIPVPAPRTLVLACDLPDAAGAVTALHAAAERAPDAEALCVRNRDGGPEWLLGLYATAAVRRAAAAYGDPRDRSVRGMLAPLAPVLVDPGDASSHDLDTWADHASWNAHLRRRAAMRAPEDRSQWRPFIVKACEAVGVDPALVDEDAILTMTREIAHAGARPMAPVSAFILGIAVGRGGDPDFLRRVIEDAVTAAPLPEQG